jgi:hypothetical protein
MLSTERLEEDFISEVTASTPFSSSSIPRRSSSVKLKCNEKSSHSHALSDAFIRITSNISNIGVK